MIELDWDYAERSGSGEATACFELMGLISERVAAARADGAFPVVLSGSCFASVGVVSGMEEAAPGVVWFDAHSDFNTPDITIEGYLDGMGMSILTGGSWQAMAAQVPGFRPVPESAAMLVGARDFDPLEKVHLDESAVGLVAPEHLRDPDALPRPSTASIRTRPAFTSTSTSTSSTPTRRRSTSTARPAASAPTSWRRT